MIDKPCHNDNTYMYVDVGRGLLILVPTYIYIYTNIYTDLYMITAIYL